MKKIRVLVVDDSAVVRKVFSDILAKDATLELMAAASDPLFALKRMEVEWPDVIVLDVEMPRMDGITFLRKIMQERPTPVVMCSTLTERGAETTMEAMSAGALGFITKPKLGAKAYLQDESQMLLDTIRAAAQARMDRMRRSSSVPAGTPVPVRQTVSVPPRRSAMTRTTERVVAIGTSTGGTHALELVLKALSKTCTGMLIVQHMPEKFTEAFANRLNGLCEITVKEAMNGDRVLPGHALIAPGGQHLMLVRDGAHYHARVVDGPLVSRHRPSVDMLFRSVATEAGSNALGIIMTGMGDDGARGLEEMHQAGALTLAQDEASCVVYGMPKEAVKRGAVDTSLPLQEIPGQIEAFSRAG